MARKKKYSGGDIPKQQLSCRQYTSVPADVFDSPNYKRLSNIAGRLLFDLLKQLSSTHINGDLVITMKVQKEQGWTSTASLMKAMDELLHYGFINQTRQGGRNKPSYYAVGWMNIRSPKEMDVKQTSSPLADYKRKMPDFKPGKKQFGISTQWRTDCQTSPPSGKRNRNATAMDSTQWNNVTPCNTPSDSTE